MIDSIEKLIVNKSGEYLTVGTLYVMYNMEGGIKHLLELHILRCRETKILLNLQRRRNVQVGNILRVKFTTISFSV